MTENQEAEKEPATQTLTGTEPDTEKATAVKEEVKTPTKEVKDEEIECPINFDHLTISALRKYQYRYKLNMEENEKNPLITREQLVQAIKKHFVRELKVDEPELIAKFLSLKKEERNQPMLWNGGHQRYTRPKRERKKVDFTPTAPGGGLGASARYTSQFNPNVTKTK